MLLDIASGKPAFLLVVLYFASIALIGWAVYLLITKLSRRWKWAYFDWDTYPFLAKVLLSFAIGCAMFIPITVVGYIFALPVITLVSYYLVLLAGALIAVFLQLSGIFAGFRRLFTFNLGILLAVAVVSALFAFDLWFVSQYGDWADGDALTHVSKILQITEHGFTLTDRQFGAPVVESRYHVNVIHTIFALPVWLGVDQWEMWRYTLPLMRMAFWSALFLLSWRFLKIGQQKLRLSDTGVLLLSVASMAAGIFLLALLEFTANYPNHIVYIWLTLFIVGVFDYFANEAKKRSMWILLIASLLLAFTHPTYAVIAACFSALVGLGFIVFNRKLITKQTMLLVSIILAILLSMAILTRLLPNQQADFYETFNQELFGEIFGLSYMLPQIPTTFVGIAQVAIQWSGAAFIFSLMRHKTERIIVAAMILFVPLVLYFPPAFTLLNILIPKFIIALFVHMGVIWWIAFGFGIMAITRLLTFKLPKKIKEVGFVSLTIILLVVTIPFVSTYDAYRELVDYSQETIVEFREDLRSVMPSEDNQVIFSDEKTSHMVPSVSNHQIIMTIWSNSSPGADRFGRNQCYEKIMEDMDPADLKSVDVDYVLTSTLYTHFEDFNAKVRESPYLREVKQGKHHVLYEFLGYNGPKGGDICQFNE